MFIEDDELREIYQIACAERLPLLEQIVLRFEQNPGDAAAFAEFLREAHTLKGDSRMLGVDNVEQVTHHLEALVSSGQENPNALSSDFCDRIYTGLDAIQQWVREAVTGEPSTLTVDTVIAAVQGNGVISECATDAVTMPGLTEVAADQSVAFEAAPEDCDPAAQAFGDELLQMIQAANAQAFLAEPTAELDTQLTEFPDPLLDDLSQDAIAIAEAEADASLLATLSPAQSDTQVLTTPDPILVPDANPAPEPLPEPIIAEDIDTTSEVAAALQANTLQAAQSTPVLQGDTLRVESHKLDTLMTQAGELRVTKSRLEQRVSSLETLLLLAEEWSRDAFVNRTVVDAAIAQTPELAEVHLRSQQRLERLQDLVTQLRNTVYTDVARLDVVSSQLESGIQTLRLKPLSTLFNLYPRMVRDLAKQQGKEIQLSLIGAETLVDKRVLEELKDPLLHLIRNAIDHGIETPDERQQAGKPRMATLNLVGYQQGNWICIRVEDDGRGLDLDAIRRTALRQRLCHEDDLATMSTAQIQSLIFRPGFSTRTQISELSGRGVGLDVVRSNVERLKGTLDVHSEPGLGSEFQLQLSTTLSTTQVMIVEVNHTPYAIPIEFVETMQRVNRQDLFALEGTQSITWDGQPISVVWLSDLLELPSAVPNTVSLKRSTVLPCLILKVGNDRLGILVDECIDQQDIVLKPQTKLLQRVRNVTGATILGDGEICIVLNPHDLVQSVRGYVPGNPRAAALKQAQQQPNLLLVEDSLIIRTQMKRLLEGSGFTVTAAVDGLDGLQKLRDGSFDAVVSDVQMPNLDGLGLTEQIRQYTEYEDLPIVLLTTLDSEADKRRGADAGASAYLVKGAFDQNLLLDTLRRLI